MVEEHLSVAPGLKEKFGKKSSHRFDETSNLKLQCFGLFIQYYLQFHLMKHWKIYFGVLGDTREFSSI